MVTTPGTKTQLTAPGDFSSSDTMCGFSLQLVLNSTSSYYYYYIWSSNARSWSTFKVLLCLCSSRQSPSSLLRASTARLCSLCSWSFSFITWSNFFCRTFSCFWSLRCSSNCKNTQTPPHICKGEDIFPEYQSSFQHSLLFPSFIIHSPAQHASWWWPPVSALECLVCSDFASAAWPPSLNSHREFQVKHHPRARAESDLSHADIKIWTSLLQKKMHEIIFGIPVWDYKKSVAPKCEKSLWHPS